MKKRSLREMTCPLLLSATLAVASTGAQAASIDIPVTNPGAETGDLTGWTSTKTNWPTDDYSAINDSTESPEGAYYFGLDPSVFPSNALDFANGTYPPTYSLKSAKLNLPSFAGTLDDIFVSGWSRDSGLTLVLEDWDASAVYEYELRQVFSVTLYDASNNYLGGLGYYTWRSTDWAWAERNFSWWSQWDAKKDQISSIELRFETKISNWGPWDSSTPDLNTIDPSSIDDAYYTWIGRDGNSYQGSLADYSGDQLPVIGFDDVGLRITTVPVPAAVWLFGSGLVAFLSLGRKGRST